MKNGDVVYYFDPKVCHIRATIVDKYPSATDCYVGIRLANSSRTYLHKAWVYTSPNILVLALMQHIVKNLHRPNGELIFFLFGRNIYAGTLTKIGRKYNHIAYGSKMFKRVKHLTAPTLHELGKALIDNIIYDCKEST